MSGSSYGSGSVPPVIDYAATLDRDPGCVLLPGSWYVTHPLGGPAAGTFTEVAFDPWLPAQPDAVLDEVVHRVAVDLYGRAWAFTYRPDQYEQAIGRHGMRRRERVIVTRINVWTDTREEPRP